MAETVDTAMLTGAAPRNTRLRAEKLFLGGLIVALLLRLALMFGLGAIFDGLGASGGWIAAGLPWVALIVAGAALAMIHSTLPPARDTLLSGRLIRHGTGWALAAALFLIVALVGTRAAGPARSLAQPLLDNGLLALGLGILVVGAAQVTLGRLWAARIAALLGIVVVLILLFAGALGKPGKIAVTFGDGHGIFLAGWMTLVAAALAIIGSTGELLQRPGPVERVFALNLTAKVAAVPMALVAVAIFTGGTIWTVVYSFTDSKLLPRERWVGLAQYERLWGENRWITSIENLMIYGICALVFSLVIGFLLAVLLDQKIRFENTFRTIFLYPFALSFIVTGLVWQWVLNPQFGAQKVLRDIPISWHWFENLVAWLFGVDIIGGFAEINFDPLYNQDIVIYGILIAGLWHGTGLIMCLMLAGLRGIDQEIWKATRVDGIPAWKTYIRIVIPMMRPVFITTLVLIASGIVRLYDLVVAQTSGGPGIASEVPAKYVYDKMFLGQNLAQGFAASTMMFLTVLVVLIPWAYLEFGGRKRV